MDNDDINTIIDNEYLLGVRQELALRKEELSTDVHLKELENKINEEEKRIEEEKQKHRRLSNEVNIFFMLREYLNAINAHTLMPQCKLKIIVMAYRQKKYFFEIIIYSADKWQNYFINRLRNILKENWLSEIGEDQKIDLEPTEIVKDRIYATTYLIKSKHDENNPLNFFYNNNI